MSLVADYGSSSENEQSDSESSDSNSSADGIPHNTSKKFPAPDFMCEQSKTTSNLLQTSVFANPFKDAENAKQAILEKHVKMVNSHENITTINGKKICWNFRKGKCRFGHNCVYAHDSDIQKSEEQLAVEGQLKQKDHSYIKSSNFEGVTGMVQHNQKRKKRPGLTQGLTPGKKVMKTYHEQKTKCVP